MEYSEFGPNRKAVSSRACFDIANRRIAFVSVSRHFPGQLIIRPQSRFEDERHRGGLEDGARLKSSRTVFANGNVVTSWIAVRDARCAVEKFNHGAVDYALRCVAKNLVRDNNNTVDLPDGNFGPKRDWKNPRCRTSCPRSELVVLGY